MTPDPLPITPLTQPPRATIKVPGSKSITNRALLCAALANGTTRIRGGLLADDTEAMIDTIKIMGAGCDTDSGDSDFGDNTWSVTGVGGKPRPASGAVINARQSGTTARFVAPVTATASVPVTIDGHEQLRDRPFNELATALSDLGAHVSGNQLPLEVCGPIKSQATVSLSGATSSQFLSGLMLAAGVLEGGMRIELTDDLISRPYVEMTAAVMRAFGVDAEVAAHEVVVTGGGYRAIPEYVVEPDASAASYFWALGAITGGNISVANLTMSSIQGDVAFAHVLEQMGATVNDGANGAVQVVSNDNTSLAGIEVDMSNISDTVPTLAVAAAFATSETRIHGVGFIRGKESDRIDAPVRELQRCGVGAEATDDGMIIRPDSSPTGAVIETYDDHRMAMAFSILGLVIGGISIQNPSCVNKTFPEFFDTLELLRRT